MTDARNAFLVIGAAMSAAAALLHVGCIIFGAGWYRFFGAGERMAQMASAGSWYPAVITACIATVLCIWSVYALSGAGIITKLPLLRVALCAVTGIYLLRAIAALPLVLLALGRSTPFWWWSSAICLVIGLTHLIGLRQVWDRL